jgi:hypothetical protein
VIFRHRVKIPYLRGTSRDKGRVLLDLGLEAWRYCASCGIPLLSLSSLLFSNFLFSSPPHHSSAEEIIICLLNGFIRVRRFKRLGIFQYRNILSFFLSFVGLLVRSCFRTFVRCFSTHVPLSVGYLHVFARSHTFSHDLTCFRTFSHDLTQRTTSCNVRHRVSVTSDTVTCFTNVRHRVSVTSDTVTCFSNVRHRDVFQ